MSLKWNNYKLLNFQNIIFKLSDVRGNVGNHPFSQIYSHTRMYNKVVIIIKVAKHEEQAHFNTIWIVKIHYNYNLLYNTTSQKLGLARIISCQK